MRQASSVNSPGGRDMEITTNTRPPFDDLLESFGNLDNDFDIITGEFDLSYCSQMRQRRCLCKILR